jgi:hypothetical protein
VVLIRAIDAGPVAAPRLAPRIRKRISTGAFHARAERAANSAPPAMPHR